MGLVLSGALEGLSDRRGGCLEIPLPLRVIMILSLSDCPFRNLIRYEAIMPMCQCCIYRLLLNISTEGALAARPEMYRQTTSSTSDFAHPEAIPVDGQVIVYLNLSCTHTRSSNFFFEKFSSNGRIKMAKRHRSASIIPPFIGCSVKDSAYVSSAAGGKGIMQYMREIMSQGPISPSRNSSAIGTPLEDRSSEGFVPVRLLPDMTPPDAKTLADELSDVIHDSLKLSVEKKWEDSNEQTTGEDSFLSDKSRITGCTNHSREVGKGLFGDRKSSHCAACAKEPSTLRDPLVFG